MRLWSLAILAGFLVAPTAHAATRPRIAWADVAVREGSDQKRIARELSALLKKATRHADWGKRKAPVRLSARVTRFAWIEGDGVVRLEVTVVGRILQGPEVRSRIRVGGHPDQRKKLEREGLRIVAEGLVTRLADIVRR